MAQQNLKRHSGATETVREVTCAQEVEPELPDNAALCRSEAPVISKGQTDSEELTHALGRGLRVSPSGSSSAALSRSGPLFSEEVAFGVLLPSLRPRAPATLHRAQANASKQSRCDLQCAHTALQRGRRCRMLLLRRLVHVRMVLQQVPGRPTTANDSKKENPQDRCGLRRFSDMFKRKTSCVCGLSAALPVVCGNFVWVSAIR